eukprot:2914791-Karenia_brevis.AAC.1
MLNNSSQYCRVGAQGQGLRGQGNQFCAISVPTFVPNNGAPMEPIFTDIGTDIFACRIVFPIGNGSPPIS